MNKTVKISLALLMALSMVASGLGIDIYYHYCGETGNRHTSVYFKTDCGPEESAHNQASCCASEPETVAAESCCHSEEMKRHIDTACTLANHCADEYKHHSEELVTTINNDNDIQLFVPYDIIRTNHLFINNLEETEMAGYLSRMPPLITHPFKKLFIFISMRVSSPEPAELA